SGDYSGGIEAGVDAIATVVRGEPLPRPQPPQATTGGFSVFSLLPVILIVSMVLGGSFKRSLGTLPGALVTGGIVGFIGWLLVGLLGAAIVAGIVGFLVTLFTAMGPGSWSSSGHGRGGFGGGFGGGGGGFGGGGGGFGGGGGSFGGGGSSGGW
ncbi:MAG: YgcG family protein, partial [Chromatiales bacterium]|nr:YgcG family protein [Chromatiales bacterium]